MKHINISLKDYLFLGGSLNILNQKIETLEITAFVKVFDVRPKEQRNSEFEILNILSIGEIYMHDKRFPCRNVLLSNGNTYPALFDQSILLRLPIELPKEFIEVK